jgi:hypothetical protein
MTIDRTLVPSEQWLELMGSDDPEPAPNSRAMAAARPKHRADVEPEEGPVAQCCGACVTCPVCGEAVRMTARPVI